MTNKKHSISLIGFFIILVLTFSTIRAAAELPRVAISKDGTQIFYQLYGKGEPTLVFVHGWSCDSRYWKAQLSYFSKSFRVVTLDLAGHGHSGSARKQYAMQSFGEDVQAVVKKTGGSRVILIGHSMGGWVIAETAKLMPDTIIGLIGIDTLGNIEYPMTHEEYAAMVTPLEKDFQAGCRQFVKGMISSNAYPALNEWIISDMSAAPKAVALSAMESLMSQYITGNAAKFFESINIPVITVNADKWPINYEANRRHMSSFDAIVIKDSDHFLMLNRPDEFNSALSKAIDMILKKNNK